jgi:ribosome-associated toxin RatA of RatAB toxin-antitoxin module
MVPPAFARAESETVVMDEQIGGKPFCVSKQVIHAKPDQVWEVLTDYKNVSHVFPMMKKCQIIEDHGPTKIVKHCVAPTGPVGTFEYILEIKEVAPKTIEWHRISGDFKEVDGFWKLEALEGGHSTLVTYSSHIAGGLLMPQILIKHQAHTDMPIVMSSLKREAENGAQIAGRPITARAQ